MKIEAQVVELLSQITGKKLENRDITPPVLFLTALISVLFGVIVADQTITELERERWQKTLNRFISGGSDTRQLAQLLSRGIREQKIYASSDKILALLRSLSESGKLLLIGLGYEMSSADGEIAASERNYLHRLARLAELKPSYLEVLEAGFTQQSITNFEMLEEIQSLLDPARFHELGTVFVKAANDLLSTLPFAPGKEIQRTNDTYVHLKEFQTSRKQLDNLCHQLYEAIKLCSEKNFIPSNFLEDIVELSHKLQSQSFRVSVVGEFSQGKSTLLNALLGEEIQPTRAVPCSATITTLRHGNRKQVICRYRDGRQEEIPVDQYKEKAAMSKAAALDHLSDELANFEIEEIIFEHPELNLCKSGVEIIDSPGLNEHPNRTAITEKLLKDTDAVIFLTNAARLLTEKEKELIQYVRTQLTGYADKVPAENLFVVVNFMDLLDTEEDQHDVKQRLEKFIDNENLVITGQNRIHYISAKATLKKQDEYLQSFREFTQAIEQFLVFERGAFEIKRFVFKLRDLIQKSLDCLSQTEDILTGELELSKSNKEKILEQIGEACGREVKIRNLSRRLRKQTRYESTELWNDWCSELHERMTQKSVNWKSIHNPVLSQRQLIEDYTNQFAQDFSQEISDWINNQFLETVFKPNLGELESFIYLELNSIQVEMNCIDRQTKTNLGEQIDISIKDISDNFSGAGGFLGGIGIGGALGAALFFLSPIGIFAVVGAGIATALAGAFGLGMLDVDGLEERIKQKVLAEGLTQFEASRDKAWQKIGEIINSTFNCRFDSASKVITEAISLYENLLEQQEEVYQKNLEQREVDKNWIAEKRLELENLKRLIAD